MTYKVVMVAGFVRRDMYCGMTEDEAIECCESYGWEVAPDGGFVWDLEIVEE